MVELARYDMPDQHVIVTAMIGIPILSVTFLFIAIPIGNTRSVGGSAAPATAESSR